MADNTQQIIIEFIPDTSKLQPVIDQLESLGQIDAETAQVFKNTNAQLQTRNTLLNTGLQTAEQTVGAVSGQQAQYDKLTTSVANLADQSKSAAEALTSISVSQSIKGITDTAAATNKLANQLGNVADESNVAEGATVKLRTELRNITQQLAVLFAANQQNSQEFSTLAQRAQVLSNALRVATQTVADLGSEVPQVKILSAGIEGLTGAFAAAQGAEALFGDNNKDLQQTLISVNGAIAISTGLSQILNVVRNESVITTAKLIAQETILNIEIAIENGLQSESVIVRGAATVAQNLLNAAMAANPIAIVIIAIAGLIAALISYESNTLEAVKAQAQLNAAITDAGVGLDKEIEGLQNTSARRISLLKASNAQQSEILQEGIDTQVRIIAARNTTIEDLNIALQANQNRTDAESVKAYQEAEKKKQELEFLNQTAMTQLYETENQQRTAVTQQALEEQVNFAKTQLNNQLKNTAAFFNAQRQLAAAEASQSLSQISSDDVAKRLQIESNLAEKIKEINIAQNKVTQESILADKQTALIKAQEQSKAINDRTDQAEIDAQKAVNLQEAQVQLAQEGLTQQQITEIKALAAQKNIELQRNFDKQASIEALQDQISLNNAELANVQITEEKKLNLKQTNIILESSIALLQNRGLADKEIEINAEVQAKIKADTLASLQSTNAAAASILASINAPIISGLENQLTKLEQLQSVSSGRASKLFQATQRDQITSLQDNLQAQIKIIDKITAIKLQADQKETKDVQDQFDQGLISQQDYTVKVAALIAKSTADWEAGEKKKQQATITTKEKALQAFEQAAGQALAFASTIVKVLGDVYANQDAAQQQKIDAAKQRISDLQTAGDISAKEAADRNAQIDREQRKLAHDQAIRDKNTAIFNATISVAQAILKTYAEGGFFGGIVGAAIVAAIGAAQIAVIASKPIPSYGKGKRDSYEGLAEVGETGAELIKKDGKMYVADKPMVTWLGRQDVVYNPKETIDMIESRQLVSPVLNKIAVQQEAVKFDYNKLGQVIGSNSVQKGVGVDEVFGLFEYERRKNSFTKKLTSRRKWR